MLKSRKLLQIILATQILGYGSILYADQNCQNEQSPWLLRLRGIAIAPDVSGNDISSIKGKVTDISTEIVPELDISYFFNKQISAELILGTARHTVKATETTLTPSDVDLGSVYLLPPTLTLQYHFLPNEKINPYVGAGINYTVFYNQKSGPGLDSIDYSNSFGPALQAGVDISVDKHWVVNMDVKKIFIDTNARVNVGNTVLKTHVNIDPVVYGLGIGYRF